MAKESNKLHATLLKSSLKITKWQYVVDGHSVEHSDSSGKSGSIQILRILLATLCWKEQKQDVFETSPIQSGKKGTWGLLKDALRQKAAEEWIAFWFGEKKYLDYLIKTEPKRLRIQTGVFPRNAIDIKFVKENGEYLANDDAIDVLKYAIEPTDRVPTLTDEEYAIQVGEPLTWNGRTPAQAALLGKSVWLHCLLRLESILENQVLSGNGRLGCLDDMLQSHPNTCLEPADFDKWRYRSREVTLQISDLRRHAQAVDAEPVKTYGALRHLIELVKDWAKHHRMQTANAQNICGTKQQEDDDRPESSDEAEKLLLDQLKNAVSEAVTYAERELTRLRAKIRVCKGNLRKLVENFQS